MPPYSTEEKSAAKNALPKPLFDFLDSPELHAAYADIVAESRLNLRQAAALIEVAEETLLGLEPESGFPSRVKKALPELPAENLQKLLASADAKIFSVAREHLHDTDSGT